MNTIETFVVAGIILMIVRLFLPYKGEKKTMGSQPRVRLGR